VPSFTVEAERSAKVEFQPPPKVRENDGWPPNHFSFGTQVGVKKMSATCELRPRLAESPR
jgi:hypothetical protein